jgi:hypothetical protein
VAGGEGGNAPTNQTAPQCRGSSDSRDAFSWSNAGASALAALRQPPPPTNNAAAAPPPCGPTPQIYYLPAPAAAALLGGVAAAAAPGSRLAFDFLALDVLEGRRKAPAYKARGVEGFYGELLGSVERLLLCFAG